MIVQGIRCDVCKKDYPGTSAASAKLIRKEAEAQGWSVGFPVWALMAWKEAMEFKAAGGRSPTADICPDCLKGPCARASIGSSWGPASPRDIGQDEMKRGISTGDKS